MANTLAVETVIDGARNTVLKVTGQANASDIAYTLIAVPANFSPIDANLYNRKADHFSLLNLQYNTETSTASTGAAALALDFWWDQTGTSGLLIESVTGRGILPYGPRWGGLPDQAFDAGTGTGSIGFSTQGWVTGAILNFTAILELVKRVKTV